MPPETTGENSPPQEEQLDPRTVEEVTREFAVQKLDLDAMNGDWLAGTEGVAFLFLRGEYPSLDRLKPVRHYAERLRATNSAQRAALKLRLSDPAAVAAWDRMADEYNAGLLVRAQQATARRELEAVVGEIMAFVNRVKVLANEKR